MKTTFDESVRIPDGKVQPRVYDGQVYILTTATCECREWQVCTQFPIGRCKYCGTKPKVNRG